ncbi:hypothetical protein Terro_2844 [Terriglobus roseus DSM 18391]|uniref:Lipoprotein n=1 Tax=Terriglobus roseus (strain DSM 18391 / NRRL B-41598 / KBS 63) TaxID=926566 RepID=I3ZIL2_TERRK|nr:hypothetical protein [Terriglobus roseus]AFL89080.1 hypothetical protein Terro_2844 [Terriglobus roseus DSM 18391]
MRIDRHSYTSAFALLLCIGCSSLAAQVSPARPAENTNKADAAAPAEKDLDASGVLTLEPGERFRIAVPLHPTIAINLGAAQLDITLARKVKSKQPEEDLHLIATLGVVQASISAGEKSVTLHGVAPAFSIQRNGEYHPSDYSIHFGSGNITNIGTPDESFIDTEALTNKLQALHIHLKAAAAK